MPIAAGTLLGRYEVLSRIGAGGMGEVYLARDAHLERKIALKLLPVEFSLDEGRMRRFIQEAKTISALSHPNIITIYEVGHSNDIHFIAMEFIDGLTLRQRLVQAGIPIREVLDIAIQVAGALSAAHETGVMHRDIKPENVMLRRDGYVKVLDFGLAKRSEGKMGEAGTKPPAFSTEETIPGTVMGTVHYMSPEQARGLPTDPRTDIFSLGALLYEMIAGRPPFEGSTASDVISSILFQEPQPLARYARDVPETLQWIVGKALAKKREERFQTVAEFAADLKRFAQNLDVEEELKRRAGTSPPVSLDSGLRATPAVTPLAAAEQIALLYKRNAHPDEELLKMIEGELGAQGYRVFVDRHLTIGVEWAREIERQVRASDAVIALLSMASVTSEMLTYEIQVAQDEGQKRQGKPRLLPVRVQNESPLPEPLSGLLGSIQYILWTGPQDDRPLIEGLLKALRSPSAQPSTQKLEPVGGAVPLDSEFYIVRPTDEQFRQAIQRKDSIVLVKGARQMGKTSLLARGLQQARSDGTKVILTDFQKLNAAHLESVETFFIALGEIIAHQLDLDVFPEDVWNSKRGPSINFERYLRREVLGKIPSPVVWGLDEVDRLFTCSFGSEVFGLFRSWHNERALDPMGPWQRLTLAIAYATEAHLFITDMNQSPFNVGTRLALDDFSREQVGELNRRCGSPLKGEADIELFFRLVGGQPYLVRRGLNEMASGAADLSAFEQNADRDEGPFGDHLRRILVSIAQDSSLCDVVRGILRGEGGTNPESFYRLRSAGIVRGESHHEVTLRCRIYAAYLARHLL